MKIRLDRCLVDRGLCATREKARDRILAGEVLVGGVPVTKPGAMIAEDANIEISGDGPQYVGRGGLKLDKLLEECKPSLKGLRCLDVGASTGGFTDCALQHGARLVYAVDVGYGQLAWKLRNDQRVIALERTNFRYIDPELITEKPDFICIDVSFISLAKILPKLAELTDKAEGVALIKPQFEAGRDKIGKKGVVRDSTVHYEVIRRIIDLAEENDLLVLDLDYSPIKGPEGNIEFLLHFMQKSAVRTSDQSNNSDESINSVISDQQIYELAERAKLELDSRSKTEH